MEYSASLKKIVLTATKGIPMAAVIVGKPLTPVEGAILSPLSTATDDEYFIFVKRSLMKAYNDGLVVVEFHSASQLSRFLDIRPHVGLRVFKLDINISEDKDTMDSTSSMIVVSNAISDTITDDDFSILSKVMGELDVVQRRAQPTSDIGAAIDQLMVDSTDASSDDDIDGEVKQLSNPKIKVLGM